MIRAHASGARGSSVIRALESSARGSSVIIALALVQEVAQ